jgi:hypothetical protein
VQSDPLRTDRLLWRRLETSASRGAAKFDENWITAEVVGCLLPRLDPDDPKRQERAASALRTMLLSRDPAWRDAVVNELNGVWQAKREIAVASGDQSFGATAYLLPDASGRALLAIFHGGWSSGAEFDSLWKQLQGQIKFLPASDIAQLEDAGTAEAGRLRREDLAKLVSDRDEQWWLVTDNSDRPHVGWSSLRWQAGKLAADIDYRERGSSGEIVRISGQWEVRDPRSYVLDITGTQTQGERTITVQQKTVLQRNTLTTSYRSPRALVKEWKSPMPPQFVPGALLQVLVGQLQPGPMLLKTESFIDCQLVATPEPLTVTIRPGPTTQRKAEGDDKPMRCVTAEVNGAGRVSRWYFNSTGELQYIELAGGLRCQPSDSKSIQFDFGKDGAMAP